MKNQEYSNLYKAYRSRVNDFNAIVERIIHTKNAMDHFWKYKNDYPVDWKLMAEKLTDDRNKTALLKSEIKEMKSKLRECSANHPQK